MQYGGFWRRFGAYWLDVLIMSPLIFFNLWLNSQSRQSLVYTYVPILLFNIWFYIYLVKRYGGTPGKRILSLRISKLDGSAVGYREAILRNAVLLVLSELHAATLIMGAMRMTDQEYLSLSFTERSQRMIELAPPSQMMLNILVQIWIWSEFIVLLTNKKRRAPHDFMAGTVVLYEPASPPQAESATPPPPLPPAEQTPGAS